MKASATTPLFQQQIPKGMENLLRTAFEKLEKEELVTLMVKSLLGQQSKISEKRSSDEPFFEEKTWKMIPPSVHDFPHEEFPEFGKQEKEEKKEKKKVPSKFEKVDVLFSFEPHEDKSNELVKCRHCGVNYPRGEHIWNKCKEETKLVRCDHCELQFPWGKHSWNKCKEEHSTPFNCRFCKETFRGYHDKEQCKRDHFYKK